MREYVLVGPIGGRCQGGAHIGATVKIVIINQHWLHHGGGWLVAGGQRAGEGACRCVHIAIYHTEYILSALYLY